jgi:FkbM family methyltransferase
MSVKKPPLWARPFYYAAQRGWIRLNQYSPYMRFAGLLQVFRFGLWGALKSLTPRPLAAFFSLLSGKDRYFLRLSPENAPVALRISPVNFISLLYLAKLGYRPISIDPDTHTLLMPMGSGITILLRADKSGDIAILKELLVDRDYGDSFQGYKIIDVGAYIGETALFFCSRGAQAVVAVEPAPDNAAIARDNIARSPYADRISLLTVAVAATDGEMPFYLDEGNPQMHALLPTSDNQAYFKAKGTVMVPVWSFERLMAETGWAEIDLVKLDCEGAEFPILLETRAEVLRRVKRWVIEYHAAPQLLEERLRSLGYQVERVKDFVMTGILHASRPPL